MYIVAFTGPIDHGKTSAAKFLMAQEPHSRHIESWQIIAEVAEKLNKQFDASMVRSTDLTSVNTWLFHLLEILPKVINIHPSFDQIEIREHELDQQPLMFNKLLVYIDRLKDNPGLTHEEIEDSNKEIHRPLLQWLGGYLNSTLGETIWFDEIMRRVALADESIKLYTISGLRYSAEAATIRHHGGKVIEITRPNYQISDSQDPTESNRKSIEADALIVNDGNLQDLEDVMKAVWQDLSADRLRFEYHGIN